MGVRNVVRKVNKYKISTPRFQKIYTIFIACHKKLMLNFKNNEKFYDVFDEICKKEATSSKTKMNRQIVGRKKQ